MIIAELTAADFVVADLTYARPSVYFEAGFAEREGAVIYTARADHFRARDGDAHGNLRVHFDVSMRNIVAWTGPSDDVFGARFSRRVRHVMKPILRTRAAAEAEAASAAAYRALPIPKRIQAVSRAVGKILRQAGIEPNDTSEFVRKHKYDATIAVLQGCQQSNGWSRRVLVAAAPKFRPTAIPMLPVLTGAFDAPHARTRARRAMPSAQTPIEHLVVVASEARLKMDSLQRLFPFAHLDSEAHALFWTQSRHGSQSDVADSYRVVVVDRIQSDSDAANRVAEVLARSPSEGKN